MNERERKDNRERQQLWRERHAERVSRMELALQEIIRTLGDNDKAMAVKVREIAKAGLKK